MLDQEKFMKLVEEENLDLSPSDIVLYGPSLQEYLDNDFPLKLVGSRNFWDKQDEISVAFEGFGNLFAECHLCEGEKAWIDLDGYWHSSVWFLVNHWMEVHKNQD